MPVELIDAGAGNVVELHPWFEQHGRLKIEFKGSNASVRIPQRPASCMGVNIQLGDRCHVRIGAGCGLTNTFIACYEGASVAIGDSTTFTARARFIMHEPASVTIGRDCMIGSDVQFMTSDNHTIFDAATRRRLNAPASIVVEDHVWISIQCFVLKGAHIAHNSIIGLRSVVTGRVPPHSSAAGAPARVLRTGVDWDRALWKPDCDGP